MEHSNKSEMNASKDTSKMTTLSFNPFGNLGEQIEYGALANLCGFGQDKRSSFACILAKFQEQEDTIAALKKEVRRLTRRDFYGSASEGESDDEFIDFEMNKALQKQSNCSVKVSEDGDSGFCKVCNKWEPIYKFQEGDVLTQPCKSCSR